MKNTFNVVQLNPGTVNVIVYTSYPNGTVNGSQLALSDMEAHDLAEKLIDHLMSRARVRTLALSESKGDLDRLKEK